MSTLPVRPSGITDAQGQPATLQRGARFIYFRESRCASISNHQDHTTQTLYWASGDDKIQFGTPLTDDQVKQWVEIIAQLHGFGCKRLDHHGSSNLLIFDFT